MLIMRKVHIALVGFDHDRVLKPIQMDPPNKLYLFYDDKKDEYGAFSKKCAHVIGDKVKQIIETSFIGINPWDFKNCFEHFMKVLATEEGSDITVNITSSTNLAVAAVVFASSIYKARIVYVPGKYKNPHTSIDKLDEVGGTTQSFDPFVPTKLSQIQQKILATILAKGGEVNSISSLADVLYQDETDFENKKNKYRAMTSYHIQQLEDLGYVKTIEAVEGTKKIKVRLSDAGEVIGKLYENNYK